jgi:hypothetical protein
MQISKNTTSMEAGISVAVDKKGRDLCVVVIKGTFAIGNNGKTYLAEKQEPMVYADVHYGEPDKTSIKYECDFAPFKPRADIIVNGHAVSPTGRPVDKATVVLEVGSLRKHINIIGDRHWEGGKLGMRPSAPTPFVKMPLVFERAFGGSDHSHPKQKHQGTELRNPVGVGFHKNSDSKTIKNTRLPNLEHPGHPIREWSNTPPPVGFGILGRNWHPRIKFAGTYNEEWLNDRFPFLPEDFDEQYFLSAPVDQQMPYLRGGEFIRCTNMTDDRTLAFTLPEVRIPIVYRFRDRQVNEQPNLDTLIVEPDERRFLLVWRVNVPVGRKLAALREVLVGS